MCSCSVTCVGDVLLVNTSNGVDNSHINLPAPNAPEFLCAQSGERRVTLDRATRRAPISCTASGPRRTYAEVNGQTQVFFAGGDGWLYSFDPEGDGSGGPKLLWKFDCNPKESLWELGGTGTRNNIIATPVFYDGHVYVAVGQDPEHGEGEGHLWCIDPTTKTDGSDVSPTLAVDKDGNPLSHRRLQAVIASNGDSEPPNPNSAVVWHYTGEDSNGNGKIDWEEEMHRSMGTVAIKDDILYITDFSGLVHCLNAKTSKPYWTYDMFAQSWGSPLIVDGKVYVGDEETATSPFSNTTLRAAPANRSTKST